MRSGLHQVGDGAAFAQEFRIADDVELRAMPVVALDRFARLFRRSSPAPCSCRRSRDNSVRTPAISRATFSMKLRSTLPSGCCGVGTAMKTICELSTPSWMLPVKRSRCAETLRWMTSSRPGFVDRHLACLERLDFSRVVIHADDVVADVGKAGAGDETDITGTDDGKIHGGRR